MKNLKTTLLIIAIAFGCTLTIAQPAGSSLLLDGINNYVSVPDNPALDFIDSLSFEAWINPASDSNHLIISKGWCSGSDYGYYVDLIAGKISFGWTASGNCGNGGNVVRTDSVVLQPYQCTHIAVVFSTALINIYINGIIVPSSLVLGNYMPIYNSSEPLRIGVSKPLSGNLTGYFNGEIDELRLWNYKLSSAEINARMNTALTGNEPGLVAYYDMEEPGIGAGFTLLNQCTSTGSALNGLSYGSLTSPTHVPRCSTVGMNGSGTEEVAVSVYPNPSNGNFTIDFGNSIDWKTHSLILRNILSQKIFEAIINQQIFEFSLQDKVNPGIYFLEIKDATNKSHTVLKIFIQK